MGKYTKEDLDKIWGKGIPIEKKDKSLYREDKFGNTMYRYSYGKKSPMGWEVDHSKPKAKDGSNHLNNLQPLHWKNNRKKSSKYPCKSI